MTAPLACPSIADIKQVPGAYGRFSYTATSHDGKHKQWAGENIMASESDLRAARFREAYILNARSFIACDYVVPGDQGGGMRMPLNSQCECANRRQRLAKSKAAGWQSASPLRWR